ncbi:MAG: NusG domain II-containing protein [Spirochaetes bacterium]|nr:NusG domain II-containing protein [Spirochaetota bacterium]
MLAVIAVAAALTIIVTGHSGRGVRALIYRDGVLVRTMDLARAACVDAGGMRIETKDGKVRMRSSDCVHRYCERAGWIDAPHEQIVCVPNRILIAVDGGENRCDAVSR